MNKDKENHRVLPSATTSYLACSRYNDPSASRNRRWFTRACSYDGLILHYRVQMDPVDNIRFYNTLFCRVINHVSGIKRPDLCGYGCVWCCDSCVRGELLDEEHALETELFPQIVWHYRGIKLKLEFVIT